MLAKRADAKGRISLGEKFANQEVIVERVDETEVRVTLAKIIPAREAWLYSNPAAKKAVSEGLRAAAAHEFAEAPNLKADEKLIRRREARR